MCDFIGKINVKFVFQFQAVTLKINLRLKVSGLYSSLFVMRFSLIFQKKFGGGGGGAAQ